MADAAQSKLNEYRRKRDFAATPEPSGNEPAPHAEHRRFVIQEHHASHLHWDLRLEHEGTLASWAVPKGIPAEPARNHLAVRTEDHPMLYIDFEGQIPEGQYGAGIMRIWDAGTYECLKFTPTKVIVSFHGARVRGKYALFQTNGKNWMLHRMDPPLDPTAEPMPEQVMPMLAKLTTDLPAQPEKWGYEIKWDGIRCLAYVEGGRVRLASRNLLDITSQYPELRGLGEQLGARTAVLDGEIVALDEHGRPNFGRLQYRMHLTSPAIVRRRMQEVPATFVIFDLLYFAGHSICGDTYQTRRRRLDALQLAGPAWQTPPYYADGPALRDAARDMGLEGIVAKRLDSPYEPGKRTGHWLKIKNVKRQELVVAGWYPGEGSREGRIGALLMGYYDRSPAEAKEQAAPQRLLFAGKVGTGFTEKELDKLWVLLRPDRRAVTPFDGPKQPQKSAIFVEPKHVAEIEFTEWTHDDTLRHPSYKGLRDDKPPTDVVRED